MIKRPRRARPRPPPFLRIFGMDAERWAKRHGLLPFSYCCDRCGAVLTTTIPFVEGKRRGLTAPTCSCGNVNVPYCVLLADDGKLFVRRQPRPKR